MKKVSLLLDADLWARVRRACAVHQTSASQLVTGLLLRQLHRWERTPSAPPAPHTTSRSPDDTPRA
jgi:hypothetical protein